MVSSSGRVCVCWTCSPRESRFQIKMDLAKDETFLTSRGLIPGYGVEDLPCLECVNIGQGHFSNWVKLFKRRRCLGRLAFGSVERLHCFPEKWLSSAFGKWCRPNMFCNHV